METRAPRHCPTPSAAYRAEADLVFVISSSSCPLNDLACDGDIDNVGGLAACAQPTISSAEPKLRSPGDIANDFWQSLDPIDLMTTDARLHSVSPGAFDQRASGMGVAGLGDAAASDGLAARLLARDQAEIGHELARVCKKCGSPVSR